MCILASALQYQNVFDFEFNRHPLGINLPYSESQRSLDMSPLVVTCLFLSVPVCSFLFLWLHLLSPVYSCLFLSVPMTPLVITCLFLSVPVCSYDSTCRHLSVPVCSFLFLWLHLLSPVCSCLFLSVPMTPLVITCLFPQDTAARARLEPRMAPASTSVGWCLKSVTWGGVGVGRRWWLCGCGGWGGGSWSMSWSCQVKATYGT